MLVWVALAAVAAVASHATAVLLSPRVVMAVAEGRLSDQAGGDNTWLHAPRATPQNQQVVRTSPDLAYSACVWDLSEGPVRLTAPGWDRYFSLTLYQARTDNFFVASDRTSPEGIDVLLATEDQAADATVTEEVEVVVAPSTRGVALLRYLAPTPATFATVDRMRRDAECGRA
ncbi:DUF1254 domain-containing protein [uncultured Nocardioides sp.]|uniref:DUF1254 domain-containing protein n=1 Tax=uncultured Nocardioides sp. TaxID=198441 RepID=UPI0032B144D5